MSLKFQLCIIISYFHIYFPTPTTCTMLCAPRTSLPASSLRPWSEPHWIELKSLNFRMFSDCSHVFDVNSLLFWCFKLMFTVLTRFLMCNCSLLFSSVLICSLATSVSYLMPCIYIYLHSWLCTFHTMPTPQIKQNASTRPSRCLSHITCIVCNAASSPTNSHKCQPLKSIDRLYNSHRP